MPRPAPTCADVARGRRMRRPYEALVCPTRSVVDGVHVVLGIDDGLDHGWPICVERLGYRGFERVGAARAHCRHAEIMCGRLAISFCLQLGTVQRELPLDLLDLDEREPAIVEHDDGKREPEALGGCNLA